MLVLPMISADMIAPGYRPINIENKIININDFPEYVFVSIGNIGGKYMLNCRHNVIGDEGIISNYYKFCEVSVYAIPKERYNESIFRDYGSSDKGKEYTEKVDNYLTSSGIIKVISDVVTYTEIPILSSQENITNYYTINLGKTLDEPTRQDIKRDGKLYGYMGASILALIIIIGVIIIRRK